MAIPLIDSLKNLVTGLGTSLDKNAHNQYVFTELTSAQLKSAYRGDWIIRKIVDIPTQDAIREWRTWSGEQGQIEAIEKLEAKLDLKKRLKRVLLYDRLFGGGALMIGMRDGAWDRELRLDSVKKGDLLYVHAVDRTEITARDVDTDPLSPRYGEPKHYGIGGAINIHPSRVIRFVSRELPTSSDRSTDGWGDSIVTAIDTAVKNAGVAQEGIAGLINEASVDVIKIPDFMQSLAKADYRSRLITRFQLANQSKSMINALILDKNEEWDKIATNFSTLPDLLQKYLMIAAGAADIPATRLLGQAPDGLNATGDSDIRNYYDNVGSHQKNEIGPAMHRLDEIIIRSALGDRPDDVDYSWVPLWQPTQTEKADVLLKRSQAIANIFNTGYVPDEVMSTGVQNMLIEDNSFPGLESAIDEFAVAEPPIDENDPDVQEQFGGPQP